MERVLWLMGLVLALGCSGAPHQAPVEGDVSLPGGKPLPSGIVRFLPVDETKGKPSFAAIKDGKYALPAAKGPTVGKQRVEITAQRKSAEKQPAQDGPPGQLVEVDEQYIAAPYNIESQHVIEIAAGPNKHDFKVETIDASKGR